MTDLFALLGDLHAVGDLTGWELASDRGNLSESDAQQLAVMRATIDTLYAQAKARWEAATPDEIRVYDARVASLPDDPTDLILVEARRRAPQTCAPERTFDAWAIWTTLRLTWTTVPR